MPELQRDVYLLDRGGSASARLVFQHNALIQMQGWRVHPNVRAAITNLKTPLIADLATGNAIWAFEVAREFPNAEITGLDISAEQYPPKMSWPATVKLEHGDLFAPVPEKYQGYFDVVHIRLIVAAIYTMDKDVLMKNVLQMIKPGGYIQWDELLDPISLTVDQNLNVSHEMSNYIDRMFRLSNFRPATQWAATIPEVFAQYGLENIIGHKPQLIPSTLPQQTESLRWSCREVMNVAVKMGKPGAERQLELAMQDFDELLASGCMCAYAWIVTIGRKPAAV